MLNIIGGTYHERCVFPTWDEMYGSGLRACISISNIVEEITLYTPAKSKTKRHLEALSDQHKFNLKVYESDCLIRFEYLHGLSDPHITPPINSIPVLDGINISDGNILKYGVLEADFVTHGKRVVYDPQSPNNPKPYHENGSTAEELALVLNSSEAKALAQKNDIISAGKNLAQNAEVVIIKMGSKGAVVFTNSGHEKVPAYETDNVWKIGSGDIFSAVFSAYWAELREDAYKAASKASKATAVFCNSTSIPIDENFAEPSNFSFSELEINTEKSSSSQYDVYLAGPFFSLSEYWLVNETRKCLSSNGLKIFSPIHEVGSGEANKKITEEDLEGLKKSKLIFAIADGKDVGTMFEIGYARSENIPVIVYSTLDLNHNSTMLDGSGCKIYDDFTTAIYKAVWEITKL